MIEAESPNLFTRRAFVKGVGALAGTTLLSPYDMQAQNTLECGVTFPDRDLELLQNPVDALQGQIYTEFQVIATTPDVAYRLTKYKIITRNTLPGADSDLRLWNVDNLSLLYNILRNVPGHMMEESEGERIHMALEYLPESACGCGGLSYNDHNPDKTHDQDVIWLNAYDFKKERSAEGNRNAFEKTLHEIVHRYDLDVAKKAAHSAMAEIMGGDFMQASRRVLHVLSEKKADAQSPAQQKAHFILGKAFSMTNEVGGEMTDYREAVAYLSQLYPYGSESFHTNVEEFLGKRVAAALYDVLRDKIFLGKEYPYFPEICG